MGALLVGIPVNDIAGWWRICFWVSTIPATTLVLAMIFCAESPSWLYKQGKAAEAEVEFEKLFGVAHVKVAMTELTKLDRGDDIDSVKISKLLSGPHFRESGSTIKSCKCLHRDCELNRKKESTCFLCWVGTELMLGQM
ncbi:probable plastidic glucose transporter 2 [Humulus lupulus]|uniref:probable plastidic glucose transporter 2 n=1 Tax=Humulus lupulus TaxID=3486 RepID=UPI002B4102B2|nr:probable plastidic glucose transporter 2 [Humulus lupulus]